MRRFTIFSSVRAQRGEDCTYEKYLEMADSPKVRNYCRQIAEADGDHDLQNKIKKCLPIITWQAAFDGRRLNKEAQPSGLFMLDVDGVEDPFEVYSKKIARRIQELGIVFVGKTASCHGLRIIAKCPKGLNTIPDAQKWLSSNLKLKKDEACKDFARSSYLVTSDYTYFMDAKAIWQEDPDPEEIYPVEGSEEAASAPRFNTPEVSMDQVLEDSSKNYLAEMERLGIPTGEEDTAGSKTPSDNEESKEEQPSDGEAGGADNQTPGDQREGLFGGPTDYKGIPYDRICRTWLEHTGGEPTKGERNTRLFKLATRLRYICDFNEATMLRVIPTYGLPAEEVKSLVRSSLNMARASDMPLDLQETLEIIDKQIKVAGDDDEEDIPDITTDATIIPNLPPVFKQWFEIAPDDFKAAVTLCQLPILGALGSRLRAEYLDGKMHSPSFQVSLEAPQASGKSFLVMLINEELKQMMESDEAQRELERAYQEKVAEMKMLNIKINVDNKNEILGNKPKGIVRYLPATISITKLLQRMDSAQGLHCFAFAEEIDTVKKAFGRGFSNLSEMMRVAFDNGLYGQDYASDNSWSGNVQLFYNTLFSGTPKAMRRFYPDVEDGLVSRVLFVTLPDQFGKPMPVWGTFDKEQRRILDIGLTRLSEISLQGTEVQPVHVMKMRYVNRALELWIKAQQAEAIRTDDRTRDAFCRRAAVVGFRAAMLAHFLLGEEVRGRNGKMVRDFAIWVANSMLNQHILRFNIEGTGSNINRAEKALYSLPEVFTRKEAELALERENIESPVRQILYRWKLAGLIDTVARGRAGSNNQKTDIKFKKIKQ